jgi:hypothetical protein
MITERTTERPWLQRISPPCSGSPVGRTLYSSRGKNRSSSSIRKNPFHDRKKLLSSGSPLKFSFYSQNSSLQELEVQNQPIH